VARTFWGMRDEKSWEGTAANTNGKMLSTNKVASIG